MDTPSCEFFNILALEVSRRALVLLVWTLFTPRRHRRRRAVRGALEGHPPDAPPSSDERGRYLGAARRSTSSSASTTAVLFNQARAPVP